MALLLPADLEPFADPDEWDSAAVYALTLKRPVDPEAAWDREYDVRPEWFEEFLHAGTIVYVGATANVLSRLEDHRDGEVRQAALLKICEIDSLRNVWLFKNKDRAFERESGLAMKMANEYPGYYVHQR